MPRPVFLPKSIFTSFASPFFASPNGASPLKSSCPSVSFATQSIRPFAPSTSAVRMIVVERSASSSVKTLPGCACFCVKAYSVFLSVTPKRLKALFECGSGFIELSICWKFSHCLPVMSKSR